MIDVALASKHSRSKDMGSKGHHADWSRIQSHKLLWIARSCHDCLIAYDQEPMGLLGGSRTAWRLHIGRSRVCHVAHICGEQSHISKVDHVELTHSFNAAPASGLCACRLQQTYVLWKSVRSSDCHMTTPRSAARLSECPRLGGQHLLL